MHFSIEWLYSCVHSKTSYTTRFFFFYHSLPLSSSSSFHFLIRFFCGKCVSHVFIFLSYIYLWFDWNAFMVTTRHKNISSIKCIACTYSYMNISRKLLRLWERKPKFLFLLVAVNKMGERKKTDRNEISAIRWKQNCQFSYWPNDISF